MKSRLLFRESGHPIRTRSRFDGWWIVAALALVLAFYGTGHWIDHGEPIAKAEGYAIGQAQAIVLLQPVLDRAFEAGFEHGQAQCLAPTGAGLVQVRR